jgi:hypothetical protein
VEVITIKSEGEGVVFNVPTTTVDDPIVIDDDVVLEVNDDMAIPKIPEIPSIPNIPTAGLPTRRKRKMHFAFLAPTLLSQSGKS